MDESSLFLRFGVALAIGLLVGLQREYSYSNPDEQLFGGIRTFSLMGLIGGVAAMASDQLDSPWPFATIVLVLGAFLTVTYYVDTQRGEIGLTTEVSAVATVLAGALAYWNQIALAVAVGVATTTLLSIKLEMQQFVRNITRDDVFATLKFAIITAIILPVLPNQTFGPPPYDVFNPYKIWLLVVLISGISFVGYILIKVVGAQRGIGLMGLLGGLASSTAVTLSFTQRSQTDQGLAKPFALAITIAWTVMFARVLIAVAAVNPELISLLYLPIGTSVVAGLAYCGYLFFSQHTGRQEGKEEVSFSNPFELGPAIKFGILFTFILLISKAAQVLFGNTGIYVSSLVSGLADADAIALSVAELSLKTGPDSLPLDIAAQAVVLAAVANTFAKGVIVLTGGSTALRRAILPGFVLMMITGVIVVFLFT